MSGIYIPGMEMPVTCCHCPLMGYDPDRAWHDMGARTGAHICVLTGALIDNTKREEHCPLVPVPDHGRLIDADAFYKSFKRWLVKFYDAYEKDKKDERIAALLELDLAVRATLEDAPTIIPADKEGEG